MRADGWPSWLLAGLAAVLVAAGLWVSGGPAAGRAERRDQAREGDLGAIQGVLACASGAGEALPASLDALNGGPDGLCGPVPRRADPFTGAPYPYERLGERRYRLCAGFERPELIAPYAYSEESFDPATGCREVTLPPVEAI